MGRRSSKKLDSAPAQKVREEAALEASRRVMELFVRRGTSNVPIRELAAHAGISERTFYRYFPRKEDAIRPSVDAGIARIVERIRDARRTVPLRTAVQRAYAEELGDAADWAALGRVFNETESLRATWLQILTDGERAIGAAMADRLGVDPTSQRARLAGALVVTAARAALDAALESGGRKQPREAFAENLRWLSPLLFEAERSSRGQ